ncbi:MAG: ATP-dependent Clp protease adaptor ClpS [Bacteroidia bacterium]
MPFRSQTITREQALFDVLTIDQLQRKLIVWNDEVNTFDWVIQSLVEICDHMPEQAEQCAWLIHTKGKYAVKRGEEDELRMMREALADRGIGATVEN